MSILKIKSALELALSVVTPVGVDTVYENIPYKPSVNKPYQEIRIIFGRPDESVLGDDYYRETGFLQINLKYPLDKGAGDVITYTELLRRTFKRGAVFTKDGLDVVVQRNSQIAFTTDSERYTAILKIYFYSEIFST